MTKHGEITLVNKYSEKILKLIEDAENMTTSDVQGGANAIVMRIIQEVKKVIIYETIWITGMSI